jgi:hypothetical protein
MESEASPSKKREVCCGLDLAAGEVHQVATSTGHLTLSQKVGLKEGHPAGSPECGSQPLCLVPMSPVLSLGPSLISLPCCVLRTVARVTGVL